MTCVHNSTIKKLNKLESSNFLRAKLFYPHIAIFEDSNSFRLITLSGKNEDNNNEGKLYNLKEEISDCALQDHLLWLILRSGAIFVTDLVNGLQIKVIIDNYLNLKFHQTSANTFLFKSEGGEYLKLPFGTEQLSEKIKEGHDVLVTLTKVLLSHMNVKFYLDTNVNGLQYYIDEKKLISECPITGQQEIISSQISVNSAHSWGELIILSDETKMWLIDLKTAKIIFEFQNLSSSFVPVMVNNNIFYYLISNNKEVCICQARISTSASENDAEQDSSRNISKATSSQEILISELNSTIDLIIASHKPAPITTQLQYLFDNIESLDLLIEAALKLYTFNTIYKPMLYTLQKRVFAKNDEKLIHNLSDILIKVDLMEYIVFRNIKSYEGVHLLEMDCKKLCITFISEMDFDIASICWLKYSELKLLLSSDDVIEILKATPTNTKMSAIIIWLKNFVPSLLEQNPFYIDLFVRWAMERIFVLEQSSYWPKIGIKFIEEITTVLESSLNVICVRPISMDDLDMLKDRIHYILELKEKYKINMLLSELSCQSPSEVALIMLRRCYTEDLESFLQDYFPTYATRHLFDMDEILRNFVESETASSGGTVDGIRLDIILKAFRSLSSKLECLLNVLKVLDVPWDSTVLQLAINAAASATKDFTVSDSDHKLAQEIQKELSYANAKVVLKKHNFPLICTDYTLVLQKLVSAPVVDLNDLKAITAVMASYTNYGNALYINKCLENCDTRSALDYFHNLPHKDKNILIKAIMMKYEQITNGSCNKMIERNYIDFMKGTYMLNDIQLKNIDNLYNLKNSYNIELDMNNIYNERICAEKYNNWLQYGKGSRATCGRGGSMTRLIPTNKAKPSSLLSLLRGVPASHQVRTFVENLITLLPGQESVSEDISSVLTQLKDGQNVSLLLESFNVLTEVINRCNEEYLHELTKHLSVLNALVNANITVKNLTIAWKFNYVFLPIWSGTAINEFIALLSDDNTIIWENSCEERGILSIQSKCEFIPFRIISNVVANMDNRKSPTENMLQFKNKVTKRLLTRAVAAQEFDELLTTILLVLLKNSECTDDELLELLRGQSESLSPGLTGYISTPAIRRTFTFDNNIEGGTVPYPPEYILKSKFNINLTEISLPENTEETWDVKVILFYILKEHPDTTSERLVELCRALNVSINDGLSLQLISLLLTWDLKYKLFRDELGRRQICIENDLSVIERCAVIWENIENRDFVKDVLNDFWKNGEVTLHGRVVSVNPYYYEVFLCIYGLIFGSTMDSSSVKEYYLLNFLKDYKRVSAPKQYEFEMFSVKGMFPEIGHYRLPFHLFMREDMWSNLKSEITLETYERWLPVVSLLSLDKDIQIAKDMICSNALKQTMTTRKRDDDNEAKEKEPWRLTSREEPLLRAAHRCVRHIANMEWAGACLFYVLQGCTRGADQVAAAHLCYQFAQRWAALQPGSRAVKQMERLHSTLSTRHVLYKIEWACEEFIRLSTEPAQLIRTLYLHPDFVNKIARHDVNRAANEIADKNNITIGSIRIQILENLLDKSMKNNKRLTLNMKELVTAKYILKATCPKMGAIYLSRIALDDDSEYNKCKKMRALQCLMSVVEPEIAAKVTNRERDALWMSLLELLSIVKLENIDMPWVVGIFMQDKGRALEQLLQTIDGNIDGLRITAELACHFGDSQIIRKLIPLLRSSGLYEELIPLLLKYSAAPNSEIFTAWRAVIMSPFHHADYPITERQKVKCLNAINLLPVCPIIKDEDLKDIWKNCVRLNSLGLGCLVLPYMTPQARQSLTELQNIDRRNLIASIKNLYADTYLVSGAMQVIESMASRVYR